MSVRPRGPAREAFWSAFERSQIPMALVDRDRRYVAVNDPLLELYQYQREDVVGRPARSGMPDEDPEVGEREWGELVRTGEVYSERVVRRTNDEPVRVSYAAHVTELEGRWVALFVVLSAQPESGGSELIGPVAARRPGDMPAPESPPELRVGTRAGRGLTPRERQIVHRVSLGRSTPQIAADLNLSPATVRSHVRNAMVKLGAHTRAQLVALVLGEGLAGPR